MGYTRTDWMKRYSERSDLSIGVVHLTRETEEHEMASLMFKILAERTLIGSTTQQGFIVGGSSAVCFQDVPLNSVCQNTWFEQKLRESGQSNKVRYAPCGFWFPKTYVYNYGGRPVIYDRTDLAKQYLPYEEWWRIVNFDLSDDEHILDWTHEREWRVKGDFVFDLD
ncbi:hypothetical protein OPW19_20535 [Vibrio europaeus]|uniref:hypothetical protein n=1 Tax=Vibrio europaeus TaxID=300876 RepID=UPI0020A62680|nr:hypothetical protein [Vibrio europaeus]MDC5822206.1 hypothetical protein [Vibrio europaeus]